MDEYEDFYEELGEFDEQIQEFKELLKRTVKNEFLEEMERLRKENKKLQGIKDNFEQVKRDYEKKKRDCEIAISKAEDNARRARLHEIMQVLRVNLWQTYPVRAYIPKCEKCNVYRHIKVALPSGKEADDDCGCNESKVILVPREESLYEFTDSRAHDHKITAWYVEKDGNGEEYYKSTTVPKGVVDHNRSFESIMEEPRHIFFTTLEECQEFCDYYNRKIGSEDYKYERDGKKIGGGD